MRQSPHTVTEIGIRKSELDALEGSEIRTVPAEKRCLKSNPELERRKTEATVHSLAPSLSEGIALVTERIIITSEKESI